MGITMSGIKVGPSPEWLVQRLQTIGVRSINNVVDVTNYVLHTYGQPLHAFDADRILNKTIIVRLGTMSGTFVTLDGKKRDVQATDLMICDDREEGLCMAGVFGGATSGITDATTNIFLESAYFDPKTIRRTSLHHGLRTDAATHFEKGVDINNLEPALIRAVALIQQVAGGSVASEITDIYPTPIKPVAFVVSYDYINRLSGKEYFHNAIQQLLTALGFEFTALNEKEFSVKVPSNKTDVLQPADIVEEILRIDGLDNVVIPEKLNISLVKALPNDRSEKEKVAQILYGNGFQEIITNSIVNSNTIRSERIL